jgi:RNA polymerase sigma-70 factor (ECF subfamily)
MTDPLGAANAQPGDEASPDEHRLADEFARNRQRLWRMVHFRLDCRLHGRIDADDVLQEAYLEAAKRVQHYAGNSSSSLFLWLRMIVHQTLVDVHRRHLGAQMRDAAREVSIHSHQHSQATSTSLAAQLLGHLTSPSQAAVKDETFRDLERALDTMDPTDREVIALRNFEELTNSEVAEVLGIGQTAASNRYVRAIKRLKEILSQMPQFCDGADD